MNINSAFDITLLFTKHVSKKKFYTEIQSVKTEYRWLGYTRLRNLHHVNKVHSNLLPSHIIVFIISRIWSLNEKDSFKATKTFRIPTFFVIKKKQSWKNTMAVNIQFLSKALVVVFVSSVTFWYSLTPYIVQPHPDIINDL